MKNFFMFPLCIMLIFMGQSRPLRGNVKKRVAVMDFTANNTSAAYGKIVRNQIEVSLYQTGNFEILERDKMELILKEQGFQVSGCIDTSCAVEIGKLLSVDFVVLGSIDRLGKFIISIKFIDIQKGLVIFADRELAMTDNDVPDAIGILVDRSSKRLNDNTDDLINKNEIKEKPLEKKIIKPGIYNPFTLPVIGMLGLTGVSFGGGYYFNMQADKQNNRYNRLVVAYRSAASEPDAVKIHKEMTEIKKKSDRYILYRNIFYGTGAGLAIFTGYIFYRYLAYAPSQGNISGGDRFTGIVPVIYAGRTDGITTNRRGEYFFQSGIFLRF